MAYYRGRGRRYDPRAEERREREQRTEERIARDREALRELSRVYRRVPLRGDVAQRAWETPEVRSFQIGQTGTGDAVYTILRGFPDEDVLFIQEASFVGWRFYRLVPRYNVPRVSELEDDERDVQTRRRR